MSAFEAIAVIVVALCVIFLVAFYGTHQAKQPPYAPIMRKSIWTIGIGFTPEGTYEVVAIFQWREGEYMSH
jgi:VIT1/CCC1 family predicted Fe2+/Mn2+ transporter